MKKKILSVLLCLCMLVTLFPSSALATDGDTSTGLTVDVIADYNAKGDGTTNDRAAIQAAIDAVYAAGGGTVVLTAGKTFLSGNIFLKSNVTLQFGDGAKLKQSGSQNDYVKPEGDTYVAYQPKFGHNSMVGVRWGHTWYESWPLVYAGEGTTNVKICGSGTIEMTPGASCDETLHICPVGFYRVDGFEVSDITITKCSNYGMMPYTCKNGLIKNVKMLNFVDANGDGISLMNCQNIRVTGCNLDTTDDTIYIFTSYADPRGGTWWSSDEPQPSKNIEIDNNKCYTTCKAFGFILWGEGCPDQSLVEASNVYVHDNTFSTMGIWYNDPFVGGSDTSTPSPTPIKNIRFENNTINKIQENFYQTPISDMNLYPCMTEMLNGDFEDKESYWTVVQNSENQSAGISGYNAGHDGKYFGYIQKLDKGDAKIYQGLRFNAGSTYNFTAKVQSSGDPVRMFVRNLDTQELIASKEFTNTEWEQQTLTFEVPETGNYHIGIERGNANAGWGRIDSASISVEDITEQTILTSQVPDKYGSDTFYELGTRFSTKVNGTITKVRIYTHASESGVHTVRLWDYKQKKLIAGPYEWDVQAGTTGWQEFELPTAVSIEANTEYVVSVSNNADTKYYAQGTGADNSFASPINNRDLVTYAKGGLWSRNAGDMPYNQTNTNYFRDIVFVTDEQTIFTTQVPTDFDSDTGPYELGTRFKVTKDGFITKVRIYTHEEESGIHTVRIWDRNKRTVIAGPYQWNVSTGTTGWQEFELPEAVRISKDTDYIVSVSSNKTTKYYARGKDSSNSFASPINNRDLVTYVGSGLFSVNLGDMPYRTKDNYSYFRDVVFVVDKADRSALRDLVNTYKDAQQGHYTDATWKAAEEAMIAAQKVLVDAKATQSDVDAAATALQTAIANLETVKTITNPTIELSATTFTYDGNAKTPTVTVKDGTVVIPATEYEVGYSNNINRGTATVTITDKSGGNYVVSGTKTFTIDPATVAAPIIQIAASTFHYNGKSQTPSVTVKDGETVIPAAEYEVSYSNNVNAGTATITITDKSEGNYVVSGTTTFEIKPAVITIKAENKDAHIGDDKLELTYKVLGLADGEKLSKEPVISCEADMNKAGQYVIAVSGAQASDNYTISYVNGTLSVTEKVVVDEKPGESKDNTSDNTLDASADTVNAEKTETVVTGDTASVTLWSAILLITFVSVLQVLRKKYH
ncbi:MAG: DUF4082 domain-containing protein [Tyzzerella sp.]|nr:DUF4082 domain-containing protein [Tyzzerella sp.]